MARPHSTLAVTLAQRRWKRDRNVLVSLRLRAHLPHEKDLINMTAEAVTRH